jgi:hypothetical protein
MGAHRHDTLATRRVAGGFSVADLAKKANVCELVIRILERGGTCNPDVTQRILDALAPPATITSNSQVNPTSILTAAAHLFQTGDTVVIAGVVGANANPNGTRVATRVDTTHFTVPVDSSTASGTGGTATVDPATTSVARL